MGSSRKLRGLKRRLAQLELDLLPAPDPTGTYSIQKQDRIRAFRVLAHAEIEAFLEDIALEIVNRSHYRYAITKKANKILKAIAQTFCRDHEPTGGKDFFDGGVKKFQEAVKKNNGIKERNVCSLFLSIGIDVGLLDNAWLNTMSSYGQKRGEVAHNSFRVTAVLDPVTEANLVHQLTTGLAQFDQDITPIRRGL